MTYVYKLESPTGKVYIGRTKEDDPKRRWQNGFGYKFNPTLYLDILSYGWNNFTHEILQACNDEVASQVERKYILEYNSNDLEKGYNINENITAMQRRKRYIFCDETREYYRSLTRLAEEVGVSRSWVCRCLQSQRKIRGKHYYWIDAIDLPPDVKLI